MPRVLSIPYVRGCRALFVAFSLWFLCSGLCYAEPEAQGVPATSAEELIIPAPPVSAEELGLPGPAEAKVPKDALEPYDPLLQGAAMSGNEPPPGPAPSEPLETLPPFSLQTVFLAAVGDIAPPLDLSMRDAVAMALENNVDIRVQRLQPELGQQQIRFARGAFDPNFSFSTQYSYSITPQNAVEYISTGGLVGGFSDPRTFTAENYFLNWQLGGKTPLGTQYSVGLNQLQARNDINIQIPPSLFFPEYTSVLGLTLTQPLLKGAGTAVNLAELRVARVQTQIGWYDWQQQIIASLSRTISLYLDLLFATENLRVREGAVRTSRMLEEQNIRRVRAGKMRPSDVWEAQTSVANNADVALRASNAFIEAQNSLKAQIFSAAQVASGPTGRLQPVDDLRIPPLQLDRSRFLLEAFAKRPEYLKLKSELEKEGIKVRFARNQIYPQIDLQASYGLTGLEGDFGNSFNEVFDGQGPAFSFGVLFSVPLGNDRELASLQSAKIKQEQATLALDRATIDLTLDVDTAMGLVETTRKQVEVASQTTQSARLTAEAQEKLLEEGKATTFDVVRLQNDFADASTRELAALANYRKAVLRLAVARGTLLEELGVNLEKEAEDTLPPRQDAVRARPASTDSSNKPVAEALHVSATRPQSIFFDPLPSRSVGGRPVILSARSESQGPVEFRSSNPRVAVVKGRRLLVVGAGKATITAQQGGGTHWMPAKASQIFTVNRASQKVSFPPPRTPRFAPHRTFILNATASSGGPLRFAAEPRGIVEISGSLATMIKRGRVLITAIQDGTANYEPAEATRSVKLH